MLGVKNIVLTIDYELFFGPESGTVDQCMIIPTKKLIDLCEEYDSTMTVFWDILHYYKLLELENQYPILKEDRVKIENQVGELISKGHDIQLHIHPHWLDTEYIDGKWRFSYERFSLHQLSALDDESDITTISGCIKICKNLVEKVSHKYDKTHKVNTIRAGGYLIEPFEFLRESLIRNEVFVDSSVCPKRKVLKEDFSFDFGNYPDKLMYRFDKTPANENDQGPFLEIPIQSVYVSPIRRFWYQSLKKMNDSDKQRFGDGLGNTNTVYKGRNKKIRTKIKKILSAEYSQLSTDNCTKIKYDYLIKKSRNYSLQILHPKLMNSNSIKMMNIHLKERTLKFISIKDLLTLNI